MANRVSRLLLAVIVVMAGAAGSAYWWQHVGAGGSPPTVTVGPVATQMDIDFGLQARLSGRIVDAGSREPVADAVVRLEPFGVEVVTDDDGRFGFADLRVPPDHCPRSHLVAMRDGWGLQIVELYMRPGDNAVGDVPLRSAGDRTGEVSGRSERPERPACARGSRR